jgi:hypothetical protein
MHPAIEITLHLDEVCAAQLGSVAALESASRGLHGGTNRLPFDAARQDRGAFER